MGKRRERETGGEDEAKKHEISINVSGSKKIDDGDDSMGEFEDKWEDDIESDESVVDVQADGAHNDYDDEDEDSEDDEGKGEQETRPYLPTESLAVGAELEADPTAYDMLHSINVGWPYLSIDILRDNLGDSRTTFPASLYIIGGTQAEKQDENEITVMHMSRLHRTSREEDSDAESVEDDYKEEDPILEFRSFPVKSETNRIRAYQNDGRNFAASMHADAQLRVWDISSHIKSLEEPGNPIQSSSPIFSFSHPEEGYAIDWSSDGKSLITGDNTGVIYLTSARPDSFMTENTSPFSGHVGSVEDIAFSQTERTVFSSCGSDSTIRIWDTRLNPRKPALTVGAHSSGKVDINVISWNKKTSYLMASGADDGEFRIWDLRTFKSGKNESVARFRWHTEHISSISWCPTEDSVLAVAGGDDQTTIWDLGVEDDDEETKAINGRAGIEGVPSQLLFIHQGQQDVKEVKWHPQFPGMLVTTALEGFNEVFKTISV